MLEDVSGVLADDAPMRAYGVCATEHDGEPALLVAGYGEANRLLCWRDGELVDRARSPLTDADGHALGVAAGDVDGDGTEELYVHNSGSFGGQTHEPDHLLRRHSNGAGWHDLLGEPRNGDARSFTSGRSVAVVDRDGSGTYAVLRTSYAAPMHCYEFAGSGAEDIADDLGIGFVSGGRTLVTGPLVSDRTDVFLGNERGPNLLLRHDDGGGFTDFAPECGVSDTHGDARGGALLDVGGEFGLVYGNWEGHHRLFVPAGGGRTQFADIAPPELSAPSAVRTVVAADLDNDGHQEVLFNTLEESNRLFARDPTGAATESSGWRQVDIGAAREPQGAGTGAAVADVDGDGRLELLVAHGETEPQPLSVFRVPGHDNGWLRVRPRTANGAPARGAVVRLETDAHPEDDVSEQVRAVDGGSGYLCQMEPVAHFGLGDRTIERVTVRWPDGAETTLAPERDRMVTVEHPED